MNSTQTILRSPRAKGTTLPATIRLATMAIISLGFCVAAPTVSPAHPATKVVDLIWEHLGGKEQFERARYVEFTFAVETEGRLGGSRKHTWDRYKGDYVLEFTDANGAYKVFFNVDTKRGVSLKNGVRLGDEAADEALEKAYRLFINDTYWLLAPTKLQDPGARVQYLRHEGDAVGGGHGQYIVLHLFFAKQVGLTPGDQYWLYVDHSGKIAKWRYTLESGREGEYEWLEEKDCGMGLVFSTRRLSSDGKRAIVFPHVRFSETMDRSVFEYAETNP